MLGQILARHLAADDLFAGIFVSWFLFLKRPDIPAALANGGFTKLVGQFFDVQEVDSPMPWTMLRATSRAR